MSNPDETNNQEEETLPDGVPAPPPINLPEPDLIDPRTVGSTYGSKEDQGKKKKRRKKDKKRSHPLDPYQPIKQKKGCGCCGCIGSLLGLTAAIIIGLAVIVAWYGPARYIVKDKYEVVNLTEKISTISEAPTKPTFYIGNQVQYQASKTQVPIAIAANVIQVGGEFTDLLSLSGINVIANKGATVEGDLEVWALKFTDGGIEVKGEQTGKTLKKPSQ